MNKFTYGSYDPDDISSTEMVFNSSLRNYNDPSSELDARKQLSKPFKEIKEYINAALPVDSDDNVIQLILTEDNELQFRLDEDSDPVSIDLTESETTAELSEYFTLYHEDEPVRVQKFGKVVDITGAVYSAAEIADTSSPVLICTIPEGYRPKYAQRAVMQSGEGEWWGCLINPDGSVNVVRFTKGDQSVPIANHHWMMFSMTYVI